MWKERAKPYYIVTKCGCWHNHYFLYYFPFLLLLTKPVGWSKGTGIVKKKTEWKRQMISRLFAPSLQSQFWNEEMKYLKPISWWNSALFLLSFKVFRSNFVVGRLAPDLYLCSALGEAVVLGEELLPLVFPQRGGRQVQVDVFSAPQKLLAPGKLSGSDLTLF